MRKLIQRHAKKKPHSMGNNTICGPRNKRDGPRLYKCIKYFYCAAKLARKKKQNSRSPREFFADENSQYWKISFGEKQASKAVFN